MVFLKTIFLVLIIAYPGLAYTDQLSELDSYFARALIDNTLQPHEALENARAGDQLNLQLDSYLIAGYASAAEALVKADNPKSLEYLTFLVDLWSEWQTSLVVLPKVYPGAADEPDFLGWVTPGRSPTTGASMSIDYHLHDSYFWREYLRIARILRLAREKFAEAPEHWDEMANSIDEFFVHNVWVKWNSRGCPNNEFDFADFYLLGRLTHIDSHFAHAAAELLSRSDEVKERIGFAILGQGPQQLIEQFSKKLKENISASSAITPNVGYAWKMEWKNRTLAPKPLLKNGVYQKACVVPPARFLDIQDVSHGNQVVRAVSAITALSNLDGNGHYIWSPSEIERFQSTFINQIYTPHQNPRFAENVDGSSNKTTSSFGPMSRAYLSGWAELARFISTDIQIEQSETIQNIIYETYMSSLPESPNYLPSSVVHPASLVGTLMKINSILPRRVPEAVPTPEIDLGYIPPVIVDVISPPKVKITQWCLVRAAVKKSNSRTKAPSITTPARCCAYSKKCKGSLLNKAKKLRLRGKSFRVQKVRREI